MSNYSLLIVLLAALITPIILAKLKISRIPSAVSEIIMGIIIGKSFLNWINPVDDTLNLLSSIGVIILIFIGGMEINFDLFKKNPDKISKRLGPVTISLISFSIILLTSLILSIILSKLGIFNNIVLATIIFSTVALGVVIATLKESKLLNNNFGQSVLLISVLGEFIPLVVLTIYSFFETKNAIKSLLLPSIFLVAIFLLHRFKGILVFFEKIDKETVQLDIRLIFFLIFLLTTFAETIGAENILGAFLAGAVMNLLNPGQETKEKVNSMGYGFFIPIFFITTGAKLNILSLLKDKKSLLLIPVFLICFMLAKLFIFPILNHRFGKKLAISATLLTTTTITVVLPILDVGQNLKVITPQQSGAITLAAIITCILYPMLFNKSINRYFQSINI